MENGKIQIYKKQITNLRELIKFPLEHCISGENADLEAKQAYEERAKALLKTIY